MNKVLEVFKMLTSSQSGYLNYEAVVAHLKKMVVEQMIHRNILHFRPSSDLAPREKISTRSRVDPHGMKRLQAMLHE